MSSFSVVLEEWCPIYNKIDLLSDFYLTPAFVLSHLIPDTQSKSGGGLDSYRKCKTLPTFYSVLFIIKHCTLLIYLKLKITDIYVEMTLCRCW